MGQDHIVTTLRNGLKASAAALAAGKKDPLAHAYLFSGPRGTGKTTTARILARAVNCTDLRDGDPCNECASCIAITRGSALDLIEMDAASNRGIEDIRDLREKIAFAPSDLQRKVYLLDEVHMLTDGAFNALLKTLEEPPPHAIFILATTELHKMPATIMSRCQRFDFRRFPNDAIVGRLRVICDGEGFDVPREGLLAIAVQSRGGMRDAITMLEQAVARYGPSPTTEDVLAALGLVDDPRAGALVGAIINEDLGEALRLAREVADDGIDIARFTRACVDLLRDIVPVVLSPAKAAALNLEEPQASLANQAVGRLSARRLVTAIQQLAEADFRLDPASPIPLELACAAAILEPEASVVTMVAPEGSPARDAAAPARSNGARPRQPQPADVSLSPEEDFLRRLRERCQMVNNVKLAGWLNGSCEVLAITDDGIELGFYYPFHLEKVTTDGRVTIEQQAEVLLGHPVTLRAKLLDSAPQEKKPPRSGHLAEAARAIGATPVAKE